MGKIQDIYSEKIRIRSIIPIESILKMKVSQKANDHGSLWIQVVISEEEHNNFSNTDFTNELISVFESIEGYENAIFRGKIARILYEKQEKYLLADIYGISCTCELDQKEKRRSFQNTEMTYGEIISSLAAEHSAGFLWGTAQDRKIETPIIQYDESNWGLLKRLASHYNTIIFADSQTGKVNFSFGLPFGREQKINDKSILEFGYSDVYYKEGGYDEEHDKDLYCYLKVNHYDLWNIGDFVLYKNAQFLIIEMEANYRKGELSYSYTLGRSGMIFRRKIYNDTLYGIRLKGTIKKVEIESVYLQLDIDDNECADYPWPWVPEVGNHCYLMPELNTKAILYISSSDEKDGLGIHTLRVNSDSECYKDIQNREFVTIDDKKLFLHPNDLTVEVRNNTSKINLTDVSGIHINSNYKINMSANNTIRLNAKRITVNSPQQITYQTKDSNIDICKNFNFYAPKGVQMAGKADVGAVEYNKGNPSKDKKKDISHWQASYSALAAIPSVEFSTMKSDAVVDLVACGAIAEMARGSTTIAMTEVMEGKNAEDTKYPQVFRSMDNYTLKGGYPLPEPPMFDDN